MAHPQSTEPLRPTYSRPSARERFIVPLVLTALRVGVGVVMVVHGWSKLIDWNGWREQVVSLGLPMPDLLAALAIAGEFLGGLGLIAGLLTPLAALGVLAVMITAIFTVHAGKGLLASNGGYELPLIIGLVSLYFMGRGAGPWSIDALFVRAFRSRREQRREQRGRAVTTTPDRDVEPAGGRVPA